MSDNTLESIKEIISQFNQSRRSQAPTVPYLERDRDTHVAQSRKVYESAIAFAKAMKEVPDIKNLIREKSIEFDDILRDMAQNHRSRFSSLEVDTTGPQRVQEGPSVGPHHNQQAARNVQYDQNGTRGQNAWTAAQAQARQQQARQQQARAAQIDQPVGANQLSQVASHAQYSRSVPQGQHAQGANPQAHNDSAKSTTESVQQFMAANRLRSAALRAQCANNILGAPQSQGGHQQDRPVQAGQAVVVYQHPHPGHSAQYGQRLAQDQYTQGAAPQAQYGNNAPGASQAQYGNNAPAAAQPQGCQQQNWPVQAGQAVGVYQHPHPGHPAQYGQNHAQGQYTQNAAPQAQNNYEWNYTAADAPHLPGNWFPSVAWWYTPSGNNAPGASQAQGSHQWTPPDKTDPCVRQALQTTNLLKALVAYVQSTDLLGTSPNTTSLTREQGVQVLQMIMQHLRAGNKFWNHPLNSQANHYAKAIQKAQAGVHAHGQALQAIPSVPVPAPKKAPLRKANTIQPPQTGLPAHSGLTFQLEQVNISGQGPQHTHVPPMHTLTNPPPQANQYAQIDLQGPSSQRVQLPQYGAPLQLPVHTAPQQQPFQMIHPTKTAQPGQKVQDSHDLMTVPNEIAPAHTLPDQVNAEKRTDRNRKMYNMFKHMNDNLGAHRLKTLEEKAALEQEKADFEKEKAAFAQKQAVFAQKDGVIDEATPEKTATGVEEVADHEEAAGNEVATGHEESTSVEESTGLEKNDRGDESADVEEPHRADEGPQSQEAAQDVPAQEDIQVTQNEEPSEDGEAPVTPPKNTQSPILPKAGEFHVTISKKKNKPSKTTGKKRDRSSPSKNIESPKPASKKQKRA
ncbi:hypothetical protein BT63DRAFT_450428 [Microthyrium microscopicum]|uniref:Uncharacterized protein n=1 Tax=Microthyrium microscopicum TaxID=703497 RepID=A0A6A6UVD5_9PEZI|nr:hypothetical protein BT63DRAFT_450428 [Microthyrium microscopicum]